VSVLKYTPRHEDADGSRGRSHCIVKLTTGRSW